MKKQDGAIEVDVRQVCGEISLGRSTRSTAGNQNTGSTGQQKVTIRQKDITAK